MSGPLEIQPYKSPDCECFLILNGRISDPHCNNKYVSALCNFYLIDPRLTGTAAYA